MNAIRMLYTISNYYHTSERMTSLFVKVNKFIAYVIKISHLDY